MIFSLILIIVSAFFLKYLIINISGRYAANNFGILDKLTEFHKGHKITFYPLDKILYETKENMVGVTTFLVSIIYLFLLYIHYKNSSAFNMKDLTTLLVLIFLNGIIIRLFIAYFCYGNCDMGGYEFYIEEAKKGNIFKTGRYLYTPILLIVINNIKNVSVLLSIPFYFTAKVFFTMIDILTLTCIIYISKYNGISLIKSSLFFFLNPVSVILTGYHGQFDNLAISMVLVGLFGYFKFINKPLIANIWLWIFSTLGMMVKHNIFYQLIINLHFAIKRYWIKISLFALSCFAFLLLFLPYWKDSSNEIFKCVFGNNSITGIYGISLLFNFFYLKYLFIAGLFIYPLLVKSSSLLKRTLLGMLFFIVFATGMAVQYFILPIAIGALVPSWGFLLYTFFATFVILGHPANLNLPILSYLNINLIWIAGVIWFVTEYFDVIMKSKKDIIQ